LVKVNKTQREATDFISLTQTIQNENIIIASTSTVHGSDYLEYLLPESTLGHCNGTIIYSIRKRPSGISWEEYTAKASAFIKST
jgi:transaldolase